MITDQDGGRTTDALAKSLSPGMLPVALLQGEIRRRQGMRPRVHCQLPHMGRRDSPDALEAPDDNGWKAAAAAAAATAYQCCQCSGGRIHLVDAAPGP